MAMEIAAEAVIASDCDEIEITKVYPDFENLPEHVLSHVFGYLNSRDLRRTACVSTRWNCIIKESAYWNRFDTYDLGLNYSNVMDILEELPDHIIYVRIILSEEECEECEGISFCEILKIINYKCPNIEELYIENCFLKENRPVEYLYPGFSISQSCVVYGRNSPVYLAPEHDIEHDIEFLISHLRSLRLLSFRKVSIATNILFFKYIFQELLSRVEVLELSFRLLYDPDYTQNTVSSLLHFCRTVKELHLPDTYMERNISLFTEYFRNLRVLNLAAAHFKKEDLEKLDGNVENLIELYLCEIAFQDRHFVFVHQNTFPNLELICLMNSEISKTTVENLFRSCLSLKIIVSNVTDSSCVITYGCYKKVNCGEISFKAAADCSKIHSKYIRHINAIKNHRYVQ